MPFGQFFAAGADEDLVYSLFLHLSIRLETVRRLIGFQLFDAVAVGGEHRLVFGREGGGFRDIDGFDVALVVDLQRKAKLIFPEKVVQLFAVAGEEIDAFRIKAHIVDLDQPPAAMQDGAGADADLVLAEVERDHTADDAPVMEQAQDAVVAEIHLAEVRQRVLHVVGAVEEARAGFGVERDGGGGDFAKRLQRLMHVLHPGEALAFVGEADMGGGHVGEGGEGQPAVFLIRQFLNLAALHPEQRAVMVLDPDGRFTDDPDRGLREPAHFDQPVIAGDDGRALEVDRRGEGGDGERDFARRLFHRGSARNAGHRTAKRHVCDAVPAAKERPLTAARRVGGAKVGLLDRFAIGGNGGRGPADMDAKMRLRLG